MKKLYAFLIALVFISSGRMLACDCDPMLTLKEAMGDADLVIHGKILKATLNKNFNRKGKGDENTFINEYEVLVIKKYKGGIKTDTVIVRTNTDPEQNCGLVFEENSEIFFYAYKATKDSEFYSPLKTPLFWTSSCSRTDEFTMKEQEDLEAYRRAH